LSLESVDQLDHVVFVFKEKTGWGAVARSREEGLHGREPRFKSLRNLARSFYDPFIDATGRLKGFSLVSLDASGARWRDSSKNLWALEKFLVDLPHQKIESSETRYRRLFQRFQKTGKTIQKGPFWW